MKILSQRVEPWQSIYLGVSGVTVGEKGCLITCLASITSCLNKYFSPDYIAKQTHWFDENGMFIWSALKNLGLKLDAIEHTLDEQKVISYLKDPNKFAILEVRFRSHFTLAYQSEGNGNFLEMDPWYGAINDAKHTWHTIDGVVFISKL